MRPLHLRSPIDPAIQSIGFVVRAGRKTERVGGLILNSIANTDAPQPVDHNRLTIRAAQHSTEISGKHIVNINPSIPEISDQQPIAEFSEIARRERQTPRGVQLTSGD